MKIFGIGLNKTGTSSLHEALQALGYRSLHWGGPASNRAVQRAIREGRPLLDHLGDYDAFSDIQKLSENFILLDEQYPGSRFILTTRDLDAWLRSRRRHVERNQIKAEAGRYHGNFLTIDLEQWTRDFLDHHRRVRNYFGGRERDLLVMDITAGDGYERLCPFLGVDVPDTPFPWQHRGKSPRSLRRRLRRRLVPW